MPKPSLLSEADGSIPIEPVSIAAQSLNTSPYESEIRRIGHSAFKIAQLRNKRVCSVDKANVLEVCELWREGMEEVAKDYPDVELSHMYVPTTLLPSPAMSCVR
jgi:isocitrate/isopropylmalate dehydrogenase